MHFKRAAFDPSNSSPVPVSPVSPVLGGIRRLSVSCSSPTLPPVGKASDASRASPSDVPPAAWQDFIVSQLAQLEERLHSRLDAHHNALGSSEGDTKCDTSARLSAGVRSSTSESASSPSAHHQHQHPTDADTSNRAAPDPISVQSRAAPDPISVVLETDDRLHSMIKAVRTALEASSESMSVPNYSDLDEAPPAALAADGSLKKSRWARVCRSCCGAVHHPESSFLSIWNVGLAFLIIYCGIAVPLEIAFEDDMVQEMCGYGDSRMKKGECGPFIAWWWFNTVVDLWFIGDIAINFRTGYVREGHFFYDDWQVFMRYFRGSFFQDVIGSVPLNLVLIAVDPEYPYGRDANDAEASDAEAFARLNRLLRLLRLLKLAKLTRLTKLSKSFENVEQVFKFNAGLMRIITLVLVSLFICHWFGCLWWMIADLELENEALDSKWFTGESKWGPAVWLKNAPDFGLKYVHAFYWGAGMATSMVPSEVDPVTKLEVLVTTFTLFFGLMLNAFVISSLASAVASMDSKKELAGAQLDSIRSYLIVKEVPVALRNSIIEYYEYLFTSSHGTQALQKSVFDGVPLHLAAQLALSINRRLATRCTFFRDVSNESLLHLVGEMKPIVFTPRQQIYLEGEPLTQVYFINRGLVQLTRKGEAIGMLGNNENFGLDDYVRACEAHGSHFLREPAQTSHSARTMTYCDVMILTIEELTGALAHDSVWRDRLDHLHAERANGAASEPKAKRWRLSLSFSKKKIGLSKKSGITPSMSHTKAFNLLDKDVSGSISVGELKSALVKEGLSEVSEAEIQSLIDQVDVNGDGELQLDEFEIFWELFQASCNEAAAPKQTTARSRAASLRTDGAPTRERIFLSKISGITPSMSHTKAFNLLDKDVSGSISVSELKSALVKEGLSEVSEAEIQSLIDQVDANGDGELQPDEFEIFWELFQASCNEAAAPKQTTARSRAASLRTDGPPTRERNHSKYPALGRPVLMKIPGTATHRAEEPKKSSKSMEWF